jgi:glycosyltransferase involved in cell wall biosynthesis
MKIALITPSLINGDAVSNDVAGMYRALRGRGLAAAIFAEKNRTELPSAPIDRLDSAWGQGDLIIYHHSTGCEAAVSRLEAARSAKLIKYHNITPTSYFERYFPDAARSCAEGLGQLARLVRLDAVFLVDSLFNGEDLAAIDREVAWHCLPPFTQADTLLEAVPHFDESLPDQDRRRPLDGAKPVPVLERHVQVLVVGRVMPQKNILAAVRGFARYAARRGEPAHLWIVGDAGLESYVDEVRAEIAALGLERFVSLTGKVELPHLKGYYQRADALLLLSDHEGFGVPLVEAMALGIPAIAAKTAALPHTGGDAVHYVEATDPDAVADALGRVCDGDEYRRALVRNGRRRYATEFDNRVIGQRFHQVIDQFLRGSDQTGTGSASSSVLPLVSSGSVQT